MKELRRKVLLPVLQLSELTYPDDPNSVARRIKAWKGRPALTYHFRFVSDEREGTGSNYNLFPVILDRSSAPWGLGTLFISSQLEAETQPVMSTFHALADDLGAFKEWLDNQTNPEGHSEDLLLHFPKAKQRRTTYRYRGFLQNQIKAREICTTTAKRRMATVINFYKWLMTERYFVPEHPVWEEKKYRLSIPTVAGGLLSKTVISTDLRIPALQAEDDFDGTILDGGKLRPLTGEEQGWVIEAAEAKGNSECLLLELFMLATGARIESACTLRARHFRDPAPGYSKSPAGGGEVYRLNAGPGTGIETKNNKPGTFIVPRPLYELLHVYGLSGRAKRRRGRYAERHGEHPDNYLFLTQQGNPYYSAKAESQRFNRDFDRRHTKCGQSIRQFVVDQAIPYIRAKYDSSFSYRLHDLRASFGMNLTEELLKQVEEGRLTLHKVRLIVKDLMWHRSAETTDRYLNYREKMGAFYEAINGYGEHLKQWTDRAMTGFDVGE